MPSQRKTTLLITERIISLLILLLAVQYTSSGQDLDSIKLNSYFDVLENHFMGTVVVTKNKEIIYSKSIGYSDVEHKVKNDQNTRYKIGSITKTFTAVLVLKAAEENKLNLSQTIEAYFPKIKNAKKITISDLLYHRSGIPDYTDSPLFKNANFKDDNEIKNLIYKLGSEFKPGKSSAYSNSNYYLLGTILEKVYRKPYSEILENLIIQPLGLKKTTSGINDNTKNVSTSYEFLGKWKPVDKTLFVAADGGIISTPIDVALFVNALFHHNILTMESLQLMTTMSGNFGMGIFKFPFYEYSGYGHTGRLEGFTSVFAHFPKEEITYVLNSNGTNMDNNAITIAVLSAVFGKKYKIPEFSDYRPTISELDAQSGDYISKHPKLKMSVMRVDEVLIARLDGQEPIALEPLDENKYKFDQTNAFFEFNPPENKITLIQSGETVIFYKK